jgi:hypothetical protein
MERSLRETVGAGGLLKRTVWIMILTAIGALVTYTASRALWSAFANDDFPESLAVKVELLPLIFPVHMITGGLALLLLPVVAALRHRPAWHRLIGRVAAVDVLLAGLTAFPVAWVAPVTTWSAAGFTAQATTWLVLLALGVRNIRLRRVEAHRACMLLMVATTSGAVFFRVYLALWAMLGTRRQFETFYACDAWVAWLLPLTLTAIVIARFQRPLREAAT